ncbi:YgaP family membrane protein [Nostoc sp. 'Lobaria pulmonaria (5183) cyanobiont']|uniref:YgaP family membrane protein n=1 Tax=Nostoc sp. 'Lobaria pulmonaria (5183) cyanobiont' TaxID=1618022 RepID=UPI000CF35C85|nr:DUF2892 domain-containing protein [Nostoc sp. 'Lobaria pulmonaria (5183) cyanobiont']AVH74393.1 protein of unknown function DUF2892 [Nostoc sp. 'Lobaria pulmonaria (5183) cyanobiont']
MWYKKNLPMWERMMRGAAGVAIAICGLIGLKGMPIGYLIATSGVCVGLTGFFGFCPACAMLGRKPKSSK